VFYRLDNEHVRQLVEDAVFNAEHAAACTPSGSSTLPLQLLRLTQLRYDPLRGESLTRHQPPPSVLSS